MKYKKIVIGVDQSYEDTGLSVAVDGKLKHVTHIRLGKLEDNTEKRKVLSARILRVCCKFEDRADEMMVICERIRLVSSGFLNIDYAKSIGALNACIVDAAHGFCKVYSADTRSWKSQVIGTSKPKSNSLGIDPNKWPTIEKMIEWGWEDSIMEEVSKQKKKGVFERNGKRWTYNDNAADSAGIALYGFCKGRSLKEEH